jgi:hypothetical protein
MYFMKQLSLLWGICCLLPLMAAAQANDAGFNIYIFPAYYSRHVCDYLLSNNGKEAHLLPQSVIDPNKDQEVDEASIKRYTAKFYPDADASGLFIIDWEAKPYNDLKNDKNDPKFQAAMAKYVQVIDAVKSFRPKVRVGIYGLPFRFFGDRGKTGDAANLDPLLSHCDVITPSFYIVYTDEEVGAPKNMDYLKQNLDQALNSGQRLNKQVIPFFWYKVHPGNKNFGMSVLPKDKMQRYLDFLTKYNYQGKKINGLIWWEGGPLAQSTPGNDRSQARAFSAAPGGGGGADRDSIIVNYLAPFLKKDN